MVHPLALVSLAVGVSCTVWAYRIARLRVRLLATGSRTPWSAVEPTDTMVMIVRSIGIACTVFGILGVLGSVG
jgi:hypothetical protein